MKTIFFIIGYLVSGFLVLHFGLTFSSMRFDNLSDFSDWSNPPHSIFLVLVFIMISGTILGMFLAYTIENNSQSINESFLTIFVINIFSFALANFIVSLLSFSRRGGYTETYEWILNNLGWEPLIFLFVIIPIVGTIVGTILALIIDYLVPNKSIDDSNVDYYPETYGVQPCSYKSEDTEKDL